MVEPSLPLQNTGSVFAVTPTEAALIAAFPLKGIHAVVDDGEIELRQEAGESGAAGDRQPRDVDRV